MKTDLWIAETTVQNQRMRSSGITPIDPELGEFVEDFSAEQCEILAGVYLMFWRELDRRAFELRRTRGETLFIAVRDGRKICVMLPPADWFGG